MRNMTRTSRPVACITAAIIAAGACVSAPVQAQQYPDKPIRFIVPSAPGGGPDTVARLLAPLLSEQMKQQVVVDNRPGGAFVIGLKALTASDPDGYTIGYGSVGPLAISPNLVRKLPYDPDKDIQAIAQVGMSQCIIGVNLALPVKSVKELIQYAKANPDKATYGASNGAIGHVAPELFNVMTGTRLVHISYKSGAQAVTDLMGGQIQMVFGNLPEIWSHVKSGKVRGIAVTGPRRSPGFPDLPTVSESGVPGYSAISWGGIVAPMGVPKPIADKLNAEINRAIQHPTFQKRYRDIGNEPLTGTPEHFAKFIREERAKWAKVVKDANIKAD
jgi:tripartite-type tricarboxylate transporter receptor subunit TctC